jgi:hypothetical protein
MTNNEILQILVLQIEINNPSTTLCNFTNYIKNEKN